MWFSGILMEHFSVIIVSTQTSLGGAQTLHGQKYADTPSN